MGPKEDNIESKHVRIKRTVLKENGTNGNIQQGYTDIRSFRN